MFRENVRHLVEYEHFNKRTGQFCVGGSLVEFSPATRETGVRFPANAEYFHFVAFQFQLQHDRKPGLVTQKYSSNKLSLPCGLLVGIWRFHRHGPVPIPSVGIFSENLNLKQFVFTFSNTFSQTKPF